MASNSGSETGLVSGIGSFSAHATLLLLHKAGSMGFQLDPSETVTTLNPLTLGLTYS